jgi:predicted phosphodiesterase
VRLVVLSDVHANLPALAAVLTAAERDGADEVLCAGDLVGYGPSPNECVALLASVGAVCVVGNHDLMALDALPGARAGVLARETITWTRKVLTPTTTQYLAGLPRRRTVHGVLLAHGSPDDPQEYVRSTERAVQLLAQLERPAQLLVLGHTHHQWAIGSRSGELLRRATGRIALDRRERYLLNPGSVGQSRDGDDLARYLVLDTTAGTVDFCVTRYDVTASSRALRAAGLPVRGLHATDRSGRELARGVRRRLLAFAGR